LARPRPKRAAHAWAEKEAIAFLRELSLGLQLTGRRAVLCLNGEPPPWASEVSEGPLFALPNRSPEDGEGAASLSDALAEAVLQGRGSGEFPRLRIDWHLGEGDFADGSRERLAGLARAALSSAGTGPTFVFDRRPRRPLSLGEGIHRHHPAVLLTVGLRLSHLADLVAEELPEGKNENVAGLRAERFLDKLKSLARLALSAALQKRDYLRRHAAASPSLGRGFLLDRSRLLAVPLGLDQAVRTLLGQGLCSAQAQETLDLGCQVLQRLAEILRQEGRASALSTCLGSPPWADDGQEEAGVTCWDEAAPVRVQLQTMGKLHAVAEGGTGVLFVPADPPPTAEQVVEWLRWAWDETSVLRLRLGRSLPSHRQLTFPAPEMLR
jgi:hypothetical protein